MNPAQQKVDFKARYGVFPQIYRAPGRVNLIGEHTDYNGGFVMPVAIGLEARVAIAARPDARIRMYSLNYDQTVIVDPALLESSTRRSADAEAHWSDYAIGVIRALRADGIPVCGADLSIDGEVPIGAGLSSSAALELAIAAAFVGIAGRRVEPRRLALLCQQAENEWVGTRCGIMDQYAAAHGRSGHALLLDCRALTHRELPLGDGFPGANRHSAKIVVCNSMVKHRHAGGEYNLRRSECERGLDSLRAAWAADPAA
ncbi:MAG: galactokinase, partial [Gammaproteobacteria bacterium]|nr:galactokinase [Gammaproteobacteria bacterium]